MSGVTFEIGLIHRVLPDPASALGPDRTCSVTPAELEGWLQERQDWWKPTPAELLEQGLSARQPGLLLTCDDGFRDFATHTLPLLEKYRVSALLFVVSDFTAGEQEPYEGLLARLSPGDWQERRLALKPLPPAERWQAVAELAREQEVDLEELYSRDLLGWEEVAALDRHPLVTLGAHGKTHAFLPGLSQAAAREEMASAKMTLERILGREVPHFSYPYGAHNRRLRRLAKKIGFTWAFTTESRPLAERDLKRPLALPRLDLANCPLEVR